MPNIPSSYELSRDKDPFPACWKVYGLNNCPPHFHSAIELCYLQQGALDTFVDGKAFTATAGELIVVSSYSIHRFLSSVSNRTLMLIIPLDYIESFRQQMSGQRFASSLLPAGEPAKQIAACIQTLLEQPKDKHMLRESYIARGQIYTILGILLETLPLCPIHQNADFSPMQEILLYMHGNFQGRISLEQIADMFGYSQSRISHIFKKNVGCSIPEYINTLRSRFAANMLLNEKLPITAVAMESGFESMRTFYRAFKASFGVAPSHYLDMARHSPNAILSHQSLTSVALTTETCVI